jgi:hypothetical protein
MQIFVADCKWCLTDFYLNTLSATNTSCVVNEQTMENTAKGRNSRETIQTNITTPGIGCLGINGRKVNVTTRCDLIHNSQ